MLCRPALAALTVLAAVFPSLHTAEALSFQYLGEFAVGAYGPDKGSAGTGTPRGLSVGPGGLLYVSDALDDQVFETSGGSLAGNIPTDPLCDITADPCLSTGTQFARGVFDVAYHPTTDEIWLADKNINGDNQTRLFQLDADGLYLDSFVVTGNVIFPRGMDVDPRNGNLLVTAFSTGGPDSVVSFDLTGGPSAVGQWFLPTAVNSEGLAHHSGDTFLLADTANDRLYEYLLPQGGSPVLLGESTFVGIDPSSIGAKTSIDYDAVNDRLYVLDDTFDRVLVFSTVPEPSTAVLLATGLAALAGRRRRRA